MRDLEILKTLSNDELLVLQAKLKQSLLPKEEPLNIPTEQSLSKIPKEEPDFFGKTKQVLKNVSGDLNDLANATASGLTMGFINKPKALLRALEAQKLPEFKDLPFYEVYQKALKSVGESNKQRADRSPYLDFAGELVGGAALPFKTIGLGKLSKTSPKSVKEAMLAGAQYGALSGIGHNTDPGLGSDILSSGFGAAIGAPFTGGMQYTHNKLAKPISDQFKKWRGKTVDEAPVGLSDEATKNLNLSEKYDVPLSKGETTRNVEDLYQEALAGRGWKGAPLQDQANQFKASQQEKFLGALDKSQKTLAGTKNAFSSKGEHAQEALSYLTKRAASQKKLYEKEYEKYNEMPEIFFDKKKLTQFPQNSELKLQKEGAGPYSAATAYNLLNDFKHTVLKPKTYRVKEPNSVAGISLNALDDWFKNVGDSLAEATKKTDKRGLKIIRDNYNKTLENLVQTAIISGEPQAYKQLLLAKEKAHEWFKQYGKSKSGNLGRKFIADIVARGEKGEPYTNEQIVNRVFGASENGFHADAAEIVKSLKKYLTPDEFSNIKLEAIERFMTPLKRGDDLKARATKFVENLAKVIKQHPTLMKELLTKDDISTLKELGTLAKIVYTRPVNEMQPSSTAEFVGSARKLISKTPWIGQVLDFLIMGGKALDNQRISFNPAVIKKQLQNPQTPLSRPERALVQQAPNSILHSSDNKSDELEKEQNYAKGGHVVGKHYNTLSNAFINLAKDPNNATSLSDVQNWLKNFAKLHELNDETAYKEALKYISKIKTKGQLTILLTYINKIPNISKKKILEIRKSLAKALSSKA